MSPRNLLVFLVTDAATPVKVSFTSLTFVGTPGIRVGLGVVIEVDDRVDCTKKISAIGQARIHQGFRSTSRNRRTVNEIVGRKSMNVLPGINN
jgi:hypothetical protein